MQLQSGVPPQCISFRLAVCAQASGGEVLSWQSGPDNKEVRATSAEAAAQIMFLYHISVVVVQD